MAVKFLIPGITLQADEIVISVRGSKSDQFNAV